MKRLKNKYNEVFNDYALEKDGDKNDDFDESLEDIMVSIDEILKSTKEGYEVEKEEKIKRKNI